MLDYAPDGMAAGGALRTGTEWALAWNSDLAPDENLLVRLIAASRQKIGRPPHAPFQPERMSGFCAGC